MKKAYNTGFSPVIAYGKTGKEEIVISGKSPKNTSYRKRAELEPQGALTDAKKYPILGHKMGMVATAVGRTVTV